jgi:hypothetical protein
MEKELMDLEKAMMLWIIFLATVTASAIPVVVLHAASAQHGV